MFWQKTKKKKTKKTNQDTERRSQGIAPLGRSTSSTGRPGRVRLGKGPTGKAESKGKATFLSSPCLLAPRALLSLSRRVAVQKSMLTLVGKTNRVYSQPSSCGFKILSWPKSLLGFSLSYRKIQMNFLANSILWNKISPNSVLKAAAFL